MTKLYYTAPSDEAFNDMKRVCKAVWNTYDDTYGYASEKMQRVEDMGNIKDNFMSMFAMFDHINQRIVVDRLQKETKDELRARLVEMNLEHGW